MKVIRADSIDWQPASHEDSANPGVWKRVLARRDDLIAGRVQMVNWSRLPPHASFRPHYHEDMQEVFVIIQGSVRMDAGGESTTLAAGDLVLIEPGEVHSMVNLNDAPAEYLVFGVSAETGGRTVVIGIEGEQAKPVNGAKSND